MKTKTIEEASKIYRWFMPLPELDIHPKLVQYIKLAETQEGIGSEAVRAPRLTLEGEEREEILKIIKRGDFFTTTTSRLVVNKNLINR